MRRRGFVGYAQLLSSCTVQVHLEQLRILSQRSGRVRRSHERALSEGAPSERAEERAVVGRVRLVFAHRANFILVGGRSGTVGQSVARRGRGERESGAERRALVPDTSHREQSNFWEGKADHFGYFPDARSLKTGRCS